MTKRECERKRRIDEKAMNDLFMAIERWRRDEIKAGNVKIPRRNSTVLSGSNVTADEFNANPIKYLGDVAGSIKWA